MLRAIKQGAAIVKRTVIGDQLVRRMPFWYKPALRLFDRLSNASLDERRAVSEALLQKVLRAAQRTAYGQGRGRRIEDWPLLEKDTVRVSPESFLSCPAWLTVPASTSGTTGLPLKLYRSFFSVSVEQAAIDRLLIVNGANPRTQRVAVLRGDNIKSPSDMTPPFWRFDSGGKRMVMSSNHLNEQTFDAYYEALQTFAPDCLMSYPTSLEMLCRLLLKTGRKLRIPLVVSSSEVLSKLTHNLAREALHAELIIDYYGQAERVAFAYSFTPGEYYFLPGYAWTELIPVEPQEDGMLYEIVGTNLWNYAMPLVRYRTGDYVKLPLGISDQEIEEIRFGLKPFGGILGRSGDILISPDGRHLTGIDHIPRDVEHVVRMQVIQERLDYVRILVVPTPEFSEADRQQILNNARLKLPDEMQISIEVVDSLVRTAQAKVPFVIRKLSGGNNDETN